jgi:hypothetical protein
MMMKKTRRILEPRVRPDVKREEDDIEAPKKRKKLEEVKPNRLRSEKMTTSWIKTIWTCCWRIRVDIDAKTQ